jgi:trans-2,3-dihydro-3-hydroxyanthranilate isomerase
MPKYRFIQLDVFTSNALEGNPLAVFPDARELSDTLMQKIAREMNLSETVFVLPSSDITALRRLRIFTPMRELPFAGHPIVGTWTALALEGVPLVSEGGSGVINLKHEVGIGVLPVDITFEGGVPIRVTMTQGRFETGAEIRDPAELERIAEGLGIEVADFDSLLPVQVASTGIRALIVPVKLLAVLGKCRINSSVLSEAYLKVGAIGCYAFTRETRSGGAAHARFFAPDDNIPEDPGTGSAAGSLSGYLVHHGALNDSGNNVHSFMIEQGDFIDRPCRIFAEVAGRTGNVERVRIGGSAVIVARGELIL